MQRRVLADIVDTLLPASPALDAEARRRVSTAATRFVVIEVESIPTFLRLPYLVAILGFQWLAIARYARPFTALPAERQSAWVGLWSNSPVGVMRDFLKLIRGCSLLAYFDHPEVRSRLDQGRATQRPVADDRIGEVAE